MCCLNICLAVFIDDDLSADKLQNWFDLTAIKNISGSHSHCSKTYIEQIRTSESSRTRDLTSSRILKESSRFLSNRLGFPWPGWLYTDIPVILYEIVQQLLFLWVENTSDAHQDTWLHAYFCSKPPCCCFLSVQCKCYLLCHFHHCLLQFAFAWSQSFIFFLYMNLIIRFQIFCTALHIKAFSIGLWYF